MSDSVLRVEIVSKTASVWNGEAKQVSFPAADGSMGILPGHQPVLSVLNEGTVKIVDTSGETHEVPIDSGFAFVDADLVTLVTGES